MPAMTTTEVVGFCDNVIQFMQANQAALEAAGLSIAKWTADLTALKQAAVEQNEKQETLKATLKQQTATTKKALDAAYNSTSTILDAMIGVLGKGTPLAKQLGKLRSSVLDTKRGKKKTA